MKEDILEQIAEDYYLAQDAFFTKSNLKFRPIKTMYGYDAKTDSVNSDIDVIAYSNNQKSTIYVVNCKSWQGGVNIDKLHNELCEAIGRNKEKIIGERDFWAHFRELCIKKWTYAFIQTLRKELGIQSQIIIDYTLFCTLTTKETDLDHDPSILKLKRVLTAHFASIDPEVDFRFSIKTIDYYILEIIKRIQAKETPAVENTHLGRTIQLLLASDQVIVKRTQLSYRKLCNLQCDDCKSPVSMSRSYYMCDLDWINEKFCLCESCYKVRGEKARPVCPTCRKRLNKYNNI